MKPLHHTIIGDFNEHWIVLLRPIVFFISGIGLSLFLYTISTAMMPDAPFFAILFFLLAYTTLMVSVHFLFSLLIRYVLSNVVISEEAIIDFTAQPGIDDEVSIIELDKINEIVKKKRGFFGNLLNYGDIVIDTGKTPITFTCYSHMSKLISLIESARDNQRSKLSKVSQKAPAAMGEAIGQT